MPFGKPAGSALLLRRPDRSPYLQLEVTVLYAVRATSEVVLRPGYQSVVTMYMYAISDLSGRELFAYHWHPDGVSASRTPHFHASAMPPALLLGRPGGSETDELTLSRIHFPTHQMGVQELVRFLITELGVGPRRADWQAVLDRIERSSQ